MLVLDQPVITLDVETTGTSPYKDRIVQVGLVKAYPDGKETEWQSYVNPGRPIPPEATAIHHITDDMVKDAPTFKSLGPMLANGFYQVHMCGYNLRFDINMLTAEFDRNGIPHPLREVKIADAFKLYQRKHPRTLAAFVKEYLGEDLEGAHDALVDARATWRGIKAFLERHADLPQTIDELHALCFEEVESGYIDPDRKFKWVNGEAVCAFGKKWNGTPLKKMDAGYLEWMIRSEFSEPVKEICRNALKGTYPTEGS